MSVYIVSCRLLDIFLSEHNLLSCLLYFSKIYRVFSKHLVKILWVSLWTPNCIIIILDNFLTDKVWVSKIRKWQIIITLHLTKRIFKKIQKIKFPMKSSKQPLQTPNIRLGLILCYAHLPNYFCNYVYIAFNNGNLWYLW